MNPRVRATAVLFVFLSALAVLPGCGDGGGRGPGAPIPKNPVATPAPGVPAPVPSLELVFTYGSEKKAWLESVTRQFNDSRTAIADGRAIVVKTVPMGSGDCIDELLNGKRQAHLTSPASDAFIKLGNAQSQAKSNRPLVGATKELVLSPVVIAMWKPMAEALGWGKKPIGWSDILALASNPTGWAAHGQPQWGAFKFGHTHPEYSNSGLISVFAEIYAASGKTRGLALEDLQKPDVGAYLSKIEQAVVHYGTSTGFFSEKMFENGPGYLSAAVLYESSVIESYNQAGLPFPIVAIYPKEGTFWSNHPVGIVDREWVTAEHREAADIYLKYLLAPAQQEKALASGFRPAILDVPLAAPVDAAHGADPAQPKTTLEVPSVAVIEGAIQLWKANKKHSNVVLVFDTSGSMQKESRMVNARSGAVKFLAMLGDEDVMSLLPFSTTFRWATQQARLREKRTEITQIVQGFYPEGGTALYDSVNEGFKYLATRPDPGRISAVVVLTDGDDTNSRIKLEALLAAIGSDGERKSIRVFTIGYGSEAKKEILSRIAKSTQAKFYEGTPQTIDAVFKDIATFF